jgi:alpha-beta hydrolase superfamily lysophospholipase
MQQQGVLMQHTQRSTHTASDVCVLLQAANWFVQNKLQEVVGLVRARPGYELLLVGHSLGAGVLRMIIQRESL